MRIEPAGHRVLIRPDPLSDVEAQELARFDSLKAAGFEITDAKDKKRKQEAVSRGTVVDIGMNAWKAFDGGDPWAKVGDRVYFAKYGGSVIEQDGESLRLINDEDVLGIIRDEVTHG